MKEKFQFLIKDAKCYVKIIVGKYKFLYFIYRFYPKFNNRIVTKETLLCIEGFPRSGNTFCYHVFKLFNPNVKVAHHIHSPVQIYLSNKYQLPCLIMIRNPLDSVSSIVIVDGKLSITTALRYYIFYYKELLKSIWNSNIIISDIEIVNNDFNNLFEFINRKFNHSFLFGALENDIISRVKLNVKNSNVGPSNLIAIPTIEKENDKQKITAEIKSNKYYNKAVELFEKAYSNRVKF